MRGVWLSALFFALSAHGQSGPAADATVQVDFSNPGLSPSQWTLILHPDGSGHFRSQTDQSKPSNQQQIEAPAVDRDVQLSAEFARRVFDAAAHNKWFNVPCESHLKVAFQGTKILTYSGPGGSGSCAFNYSTIKEIQSAADALVATAETIADGARLELLLEHDRLGLDAETQFLVEASGDGRAQQLCAIRPILERLAEDPEVLERVRKRAKTLLALAAK
jgi:hypothetical protein